MRATLCGVLEAYRDLSVKTGIVIMTILSLPHKRYTLIVLEDRGGVLSRQCKMSKDILPQ
jgi:hypothetical protein